MVKLVYIVYRRRDWSPEAFYDRWLNQHGPLVKRLADKVGARRYVQSHTLDAPLNDVLRESRGMPEHFDGITEVWWEDLETLTRAMETNEAQEAMRALIQDESEFIDFERSYIFMTQEHEIFSY